MKLKVLIAGIPEGERRALKKSLSGKTTIYDGSFGFTSTHVMVRGKRVIIAGEDEPILVSRVLKAMVD